MKKIKRYKKPTVNDIVTYRSREWFLVSITGDKAVLKLMGGQKPFMQNYQEVTLVRASLSNIKGQTVE